MPDAVWIEFEEGMTQDVYEQANNSVNPPGSPPRVAL
jgi:hypothetical protein